MLEKSQIIDLYNNFQKADELIQEVKATTCTEVIPAVLQLRYAAWHLICCLKYDLDNDQEKKLDEYRNVVEHSDRAIFEACRYGIVFCMQAVKEFKESYDKDILSSVISNYSEKMHSFSKARDFVKIKGDKSTRAKACYEHFVSLRDILDELKACEADLNEIRKKRYDELAQKQLEIEELKEANKKQNVRFWITTALGVIGIIIALVI